MGGCCHDEIAKYVPELAKFIPLHCCNHYGAPMYPVENGMYHIKNSDKSVAIEYLRISDKEYSKLSEAVDDKMYFKYLLFNPGIVDRWKRESDELIAELENLCGKKWVNPYKPEEERFTLTLEELISSCGLTEDECRKLQEESESFNDEMIKFIDNMFGRENMISEGSTISENDTICINIKYHKIGEVFNYKVGMSEMTLRVDKCDRCSGCAFENYIYDCVKSGCLGCEREDGESVRYTIVNT